MPNGERTPAIIIAAGCFASGGGHANVAYCVYDTNHDGFVDQADRAILITKLLGP